MDVSHARAYLAIESVGVDQLTFHCGLGKAKLAAEGLAAHGGETIGCALATCAGVGAGSGFAQIR
jgi:hypothetical protein